MDDKHEEYRQRLRTMQTSHSADHIMAGLKGLGLGLYGGLTSIVSQTYTGATQEGLPVSARVSCVDCTLENDIVDLHTFFLHGFSLTVMMSVML